jgi:hypothetical protein
MKPYYLLCFTKDTNSTKGDSMGGAFGKLTSLSVIFIVGFLIVPVISWLSWQGDKNWYIGIASVSTISALVIPVFLTVYLNGTAGWLSGIIYSSAYLISVLFFWRCTNFWDELSLAIHFIGALVSIIGLTIALVFKACRI